MTHPEGRRQSKLCFTEVKPLTFSTTETPSRARGEIRRDLAFHLLHFPVCFLFLVTRCGAQLRTFKNHFLSSERKFESGSESHKDQYGGLCPFPCDDEKQPINADNSSGCWPTLSSSMNVAANENHSHHTVHRLLKRQCLLGGTMFFPVSNGVWNCRLADATQFRFVWSNSGPEIVAQKPFA